MTAQGGGGVGGGLPPGDGRGSSDPASFDPGAAPDAGGVDVVTVADEAVFERLLAGGVIGADDPAWAADLARLVRAADAPGRPDELTGEDEIVARMVDARRDAVADLPGATADATADATVVRLPARKLDEPWPGPHRQERVTAYRAKHMAARLEASSHPAVRNLGRVLAVKAAAVTTAVVVGTVAAAAAATTGIVATVVVPALTSSKAPSEPDTEADDDADGPTSEADEGDDATTGPAPSSGPATCAESPGNCSSEAPASSAPASTPSTTVTTETSDDDEPEVTTTTESPPSTTAPPTTAPTTTVPEPTTTTTTTTVDPPTTYAGSTTQSPAATQGTSAAP
jgi:hypothetical protein